MAHKTYFALSSFDYPPDNSIQLGQIITNPSKPWEKIAERLPVAKYQIQTSSKTDWGTEVYREHEQRIGIWAQFAAMILGVGGDAIVAWSRKNSEVFQFDELETTFFEPEADYVERSVIGKEREAVADWIKMNPRKSVYMITGLKIARGASHLRARARGIDFDLKPAIEATPFIGVPLSGGPLVGAGREKGESTWFSGSSDFVFAYRLRRIIIKRQTVAKSNDYVKGATVAHDEGPKASKAAYETPRTTSQGPAQNLQIQSVEQSGKDYGSAGYDVEEFSPKRVRDDQDEEDCLLQVPENLSYEFY
ncbi:unnamed protein product [Periconia digitata]|uniref:Uncharacterized protein n=1 Tax=Periconia digitata TaxID=1303443 RepID=A0A9W4UJF1_9PLEO|nr:unnamed protein product [Periconia digitata]